MIDEFIAKAENQTILALLGIKYTDEPIVRCRDCKHFETDECRCRNFVVPCTPDGAIVNRAMVSSNVNPNGFCAWGEHYD